MNDPEEYWGTGKRPERRQTPSPTPPLMPTNWSVVTWLRVITWLLPVGFSLLSAMGISWKQDLGEFDFGIGSWLFLNVIFIIGAGWYNAFLSSGGPKSHLMLSALIFRFFCLQVLLIPLVYIILIFIALTHGYYKIGC